MAKLYGFVLFTKHGFIARSGFPEKYTDLIKYARVYPMDENTVGLAFKIDAMICRVSPDMPDDGYKPESLRSDPRFVANLAGRAA
jgi:hypothetical protein